MEKMCFANTNVNNKVHMFNKTIKNIMSSYIPHETIDRDRDPPWINKDIKQLILDKNHAYKSYISNDKSLQFFNQFQFLQTKLSSLVEESKNQYYTRLSHKLLDPKTSQKSYWSILKTFLNNKKIPCIPALLHQAKYVTDLKEKANIFNNFFANQCSIVNNNSELPVTLTRKTHESLSTIDFSTDDILKIIRNLNPNKTHVHNMFSIQMIKICDTSICRPLKLIFQACLESGKFPNEWKKANVVPVHKKGDKQILKNYRPISLLPLAGKIFERLLYDRMFESFIANNLISKNQSGFRSSDSCINQLLSITHEIYQSFDDNLEVRAVFLDISKAFDKVWHKGLIFKLNQNGISDKILNIITDFLSFRKQRVILNGQASPWVSIDAGVPQGSILGPLLSLIYINDTSDDLSTTAKLFADNTSLFSIVQNVNTSASHLNNDLSKISN